MALYRDNIHVEKAKLGEQFKGTVQQDLRGVKSGIN
jgi:hypothetical protein